MAIAEMKKLSLIALRSDAEKLAAKLLKLSCVEVSAAPADDPNGLISAFSDWEEERSENERALSSAENAMSVLKQYRQAKKSMFAPPAQMKLRNILMDDGVFSEGEKLTEGTIKLSHALSSAESELAGKKLGITALNPWLDFDMPLGNCGTKSTSVMFGSFPPDFDPEKTINERERMIGDGLSDSGYEDASEDDAFADFAVGVVSRDKTAAYAAIIYNDDDDAEIQRELSKYGFVRADLSAYKNTAAKEVQALENECADISSGIDKIKEKLTSLSDNIPLLEEYIDILNSRLESTAAKQKLMRTDQTLFLSGWLPADKLGKVSAELDKFDCCYEFTDPSDEDEVPVLLSNPKIFKPFESVIELYSLPKYGSFDPTVIMSVFYFIIFGFMLADTVYGLILTVGGLLGVKLLHLRGGAKRLVQLFAVCGVSCMIAGVLTGSYLGDFPVAFMSNIIGRPIPSPALWFDPVNEPITFLIVSVGIGIIHMLFGMGIKFYMICRSGKPIAAIFDVGSWFVVFAGIGVYFINSTAGLITAAVGALMLVFSQGRAQRNPVMKGLKGLLSLYDIVSYASDLLSYTRIMALGMASAVIASVINLISTMGGATVGGIIAMIVILPFGTALNLAINLLGSFVHTSRLQYIEFFGKFYEDGGKPFAPVAPKLRYTELEENGETVK